MNFSNVPTKYLANILLVVICWGSLCNAGCCVSRSCRDKELSEIRVALANQDLPRLLELLEVPQSERLLQQTPDQGPALLQLLENLSLDHLPQRIHGPIRGFILYQADRQNRLNDTLIEEAKFGNLPGLEHAIAQGADINGKNGALSWAALMGHLAVVQFLVAHGADVHADRDLAIRLAFREKHWDIVVYLLHYGANYETELTSKQLQKEFYSSPEAQEYVAAEIQTALHQKDLLALQKLLHLISFDNLSKQTQNLIREFVQQRELQGVTKKRKTKYS